MVAKTLMVQGTASGVGKSVLVAGLCRLFAQAGWRVAPFKAQNMSLNSYVTRDGGEMGWAQVVQAEACGLEPTVEMNPILLKPEAEAISQVIVLGKPVARLSARGYYRHKARLWKVVKQSLEHLRSAYDLVIIEGAGSPAEINLKDREIVNMRVARLVGAPVLLVGDIERGGVFASLVGTLALLDDEERSLVRGLIINKFRGDPSLLEPGLGLLEERAGKPVLGVVPYVSDLYIPQEDSLFEHRARQNLSPEQCITIVVVQVARLTNSTDFEPLQQEPDVLLRYISQPKDLDGADCIILPGSKSTVADLQELRERGLAEAIVTRARDGTPVIGICGGFQMLGREIRDPYRVEADCEVTAGLGLLDVVTTFAVQKTTHQVRGSCLATNGLLEGADGISLVGYEIHMGETQRGSEAPFCRITQRGSQPVDHLDGAIDPAGTVIGTYLHGLFDNDALRRTILNQLRRRRGLALLTAQASMSRQEHYDRLAQLLRHSLDLERLCVLCGMEPLL